MTMELLFARGKIIIISIYAPALTNAKHIKAKFYEDFHAIVSSVPKNEKLFLLKDMHV